MTTNNYVQEGHSLWRGELDDGAYVAYPLHGSNTIAGKTFNYTIAHFHTVEAAERARDYLAERFENLYVGLKMSFGNSEETIQSRQKLDKRFEEWLMYAIGQDESNKN